MKIEVKNDNKLELGGVILCITTEIYVKPEIQN